MKIRLSRWLVWSFTGSGLFLILAIVPFSYLSRQAKLPADFALWPADLIYLLPALAFLLVGTLISIRQPRNAYGWVMMASGFGQITQGFWTSYGIYAFFAAAEPSPLSGLAFFLIGAGWMLWITTLPLLMLLYPTGEPRSPRWKPVIWLLVINFLIAASLSWTIDTSYGWIAVHNPYALAGSSGQILENLLIIVVIITIFLIFVSGVSLIISAYRSTGIERLQYKWFTFATAILVSELFIDLFWETSQPWEALKESLPLVFLAVAIGIAVLRYRLFEIDFIIRKTLVYTAVTVSLALIYFGSVILLQSIFEAISGQKSAISIVISTLIIAALFAPLRQYVKAVIDRRFYRKKYDAQQVLAQFAITVRAEVGMETLQAEMLNVLLETIQPVSVSLWLKPPSKN